MHLPDARTVFAYAGTAVGLMACFFGLRIAAGRLGLAVAIGIALVTFVAKQPVGFALGQTAVAAVLSVDTALPILITVEAGLVVTLLASFGGVPTTGHTVAVTGISLTGFLAFAQVFRSGFGLVIAVLVTVAGLSTVIYLVHRIEYLRMASGPEGEG